MADSQLVTYIQEQARRSVPTEAVRQALWQAGWQEREIVDAFQIATAHEGLAHLAGRVDLLEGNMLVPSRALPAPHPRRWPFLLMVMGLVVVGIAVLWQLTRW